LAKKSNKIDITQVDFEKLKDQAAENPGSITFPHNLGSAVVKPEDMGKNKGRAVAAMKEQTGMQLKQLYDQIRVLVGQAHDIKKRVEVSERIYMAQMNFEPVIGQLYYLYEKDDHSDVLSMISPDEWGKDSPFKAFIAQVKLLSDHTWEVLNANG
jgi:hypothetical protein